MQSVIVCLLLSLCRNAPPSRRGLWECNARPASLCLAPASTVPLLSRAALLPHSTKIHETPLNLHTRNAVHFNMEETYNSVDAQHLISSLQLSMSVSHTARNDSRDVDGRVLLLAAHHVEAESLLCLGQFHDSRVGVAF